MMLTRGAMINFKTKSRSSTRPLLKFHSLLQQLEALEHQFEHLKWHSSVREVHNRYQKTENGVKNILWNFAAIQ